MIETVADLLEQLEGIDPETPIAVAFQPSYPLRGKLAAVTQMPATDPGNGEYDEDGRGMLWLAVDPESSYNVDPYASADAWQGGDIR